MSILRSEAITHFLKNNTWPDLAEMYNHNMECQVNVGQDGGERIDKHFKGRESHQYTDGEQTWYRFRIPRNAWVAPENNDITMSFSLADHAEAIGMTGWDWVNKESKWLGYDFDAIIGHKEQHQKKLTDEQLEEIKNKLHQIQWTTIRKSTGGAGLHLYVFLNPPIKTVTHTEHIALARAVLSQLSAICNFDFQSKVDVNGGNMWVWHRKMRATQGEGLKLIKKGICLTQIPPNWRDHIEVVSGKRKKIKPFFITDDKNPDEATTLFDELSGQRPRIQLDSDHNRLLEWLNKNAHGGWWDSDHWMLVTHTSLLAKAHNELKLKGIFKTLAQGSELGDYNAFAYPMRNGAWAVRRFTRGCAEDQSWTQDGNGWTKCYFNRLPDIATACKAYGAIEKVAGGFLFNYARDAIKAAEMLGSKLELPPVMMNRKCVLKKHKDGRLVIELERDGTDNGGEMQGWSIEGKQWKRFGNQLNDNSSPPEVPNFDDVIRHLVTDSKGESKATNYGWVIKTPTDNQWKHEPLEHIKLALMGSYGFKKAEMEAIVGGCINQPWIIVNIPFHAEEYPSDRKWNKDAAQLKYVPSKTLDDLHYDTWMKIFDHLGRGLDAAVEINPWCMANNVKSGSDYLLLWVASMFQKPHRQLPYIFFWSTEQNTGKSAFHESLELLMIRGYQKADNALLPNVSFNAELENAILCVIEETDLNKSRTAGMTSYNRIKEWVTAKLITVHRKHKTPYMIENHCHFVQTANEKAACPIFPGDLRIVMIHVEPLDPAGMIPREELHELLKKEAPDFLAYILGIEIPVSKERLNLPVIATQDKLEAQEANMTVLEIFIKEHCYVVDGEMITLGEFYNRFKEQLEPEYHDRWTKIYTSRNLPEYHPKGRRREDAQWCIGNISFKPRDPSEPIKPKLVRHNEYLIPYINLNGIKNEIKSTNNS